MENYDWKLLDPANIIRFFFGPCKNHCLTIALSDKVHLTMKYFVRKAVAVCCFMALEANEPPTSMMILKPEWLSRQISTSWLFNISPPVQVHEQRPRKQGLQ